MTVESHAAALQAVAEMCRALKGLPEGVVFDCKLVASELLNNAIKYGGGYARFSFTQTGGQVRIAVRGALPFEPPKTCVMPSPSAESGRGLCLVDAVALKREYSEEEGIIVFVGL